jgi:quinol---cytochrome c reductase iron-sulfur subunit
VTATPGPSRNARRMARAATVAFAVASAGGIGAAISYATDHTELALGLTLTASLGGIGVGLIAWAKSLDVEERAVQEREPLRLEPDDEAGLDDQEALTAGTLGRRPLLVVLFGTSMAALLVGFFGPLGSLGPKPRGERKETGWREGSRLVTSEGEPIDVATTGFDQLATVFPEGEVGRDDSQVVLLRVEPELLSESTVAAGTVDGWVAYSKICTHAGCSVGLFGVDNRPPDVLRELVCPCHQSVFDPLNGARPVGGPAPRPLPQLALGVDDDGHLIALGDFSQPVGPITWTEG